MFLSMSVGGAAPPPEPPPGRLTSVNNMDIRRGGQLPEYVLIFYTHYQFELHKISNMLFLTAIRIVWKQKLIILGHNSAPSSWIRKKIGGSFSYQPDRPQPRKTLQNLRATKC